MDCPGDILVAEFLINLSKNLVRKLFGPSVPKVSSVYNRLEILWGAFNNSGGTEAFGQESR
jgi:hypothetical protein